MAKGHEVRQLNLYALGFDPVLRAQDWRRYLKQGQNTESVEEHLVQLRWAEGVIFVYPTWWYSLPAMLKGWLERVLVPYETFELRHGINPILGKLGQYPPYRWYFDIWFSVVVDPVCRA